MSQFLPKLFRWVFTVLAVLAGLAAACLAVVMLADPALPHDARFGPVHGEILGQPATLVLKPGDTGGGEPVFDLRAFNGSLAMTVDKPSGIVEVFKRYGLPMLLLYAAFLGALFELLRRLFRNVGRGESFTPQSVRLVQTVGGALIVFSIVSAVGESWFVHAMYAYLAEHTDIAISGAAVRLPVAGQAPMFDRLPFGGPVFFSGLLVLALAEVFRQGLALQRESDLTV